MKNSLWLAIVVAAFFLGFVVGYSQKYEMPPAGVGAGAPAAGGYGAPAPAAGGYGAPKAGGYGAPAPAAGGYGAPKAGGYGK